MTPKTTENNHAMARLKRNSEISVIWLLPLIALAMALILVYRIYSTSGIEVTVTFPDANGIIAHKTVVKYRGMQVGQVKELTLLKDTNGVSATIEMGRGTEPYLTNNLNFWLVKPKVTLNGVSGLDTLVTGAYIQIGGDNLGQGNSSRFFKALVSPPPTSIPSQLLTYKLVTQDTAGVNPGALIYHRKLEVGSVHNVQLSDDHKAIEITIAINPEYGNLIKRSSRFWSVSGIKADASLSGIKIESEGIAAMLVGGIAFSSPANGDIAEEYSEFRLYRDANSARDALELTLSLAGDSNVSVGTKVFYNAQQVGAIEQLTWDESFQRLIATAQLSHDMTRLIRDDSLFWLDTPSITFNNFSPGRLLQGPVIRFLPGTGEPASSFVVSDKPPRKPNDDNHHQLTLTSSDSFGLAQNASVYYRQHPVGQIDWIRYNAQNELFEFDVSIQPEFSSLIKPETVFYNLSGIKMTAKLTGIDVSVPSIKQALNGGIGIYNPEGLSLPESDHDFTLHEDYFTAVNTRAQQADCYFLVSEEFLSPTVNSPVYYQQFEIGQVRKVTLNKQATASVSEIIIAPEYKHLIRENTQFWQKQGVSLTATLSGVKIDTPPLMQMLLGGLSISTPDHDAPLAKNDQSFQLFTSEEAATKSLRDESTVTIEIHQHTNLKAGQAVKYRGYPVGEVTDIQLMSDLKGIAATVSFHPGFEQQFISHDTRYWLAQPKLGLTNVKNPETLITGDYLSVMPGNSDTPKETRLFTVEREAPPVEIIGDGLHITLQASALGSLKPSSPILYRQLKVGEITGYRLQDNLEIVEVSAYIYPEYIRLITDKTRFWNASGVDIKAGLFSGVEVQTQSLETIISGGIALATSSEGTSVAQHHRYQLFEQADTDWLDWVIGNDD